MQSGSTMAATMKLPAADRVGDRGALGRAFVGVATLLATLPACGGGGSQPTGSLYVTVVDKSMLPVSDATVTTEPATQSLITDAFGSVFFAKVPAGGYAITASHATRGSGRATQQVTAGAVAKVTVTLGVSTTGAGGAA